MRFERVMRHRNPSMQYKQRKHRTVTKGTRVSIGSTENMSLKFRIIDLCRNLLKHLSYRFTNVFLYNVQLYRHKCLSYFIKE